MLKKLRLCASVINYDQYKLLVSLAQHRLNSLPKEMNPLVKNWHHDCNLWFTNFNRVKLEITNMNTVELRLPVVH